MPRFSFALSRREAVRELGVVQSASFKDAMTALTDKLTVTVGDTLEIGVHGFPPARFLYVDKDSIDIRGWVPEGRQAA